MSKLLLSIEQVYPELPIDINDVKQMCQIYGQIDMEYADKLLRSAIDCAETNTGTSILRRKWSYANQRTKLVLPKPPVLKIESITVQGKTLNAATDYQIQIDAESGNATVNIDKKFENKVVTVIYESGYTKETLPPSFLSYISKIFYESYSSHDNAEMSTMYQSLGKRKKITGLYSHVE